MIIFLFISKMIKPMMEVFLKDTEYVSQVIKIYFRKM